MPLKRRNTDTHDVDPDDFPVPGYATPDTDELLGDEDGKLTVPVRVEGEVRVSPDPARVVSFRTYNALTTESVKVLPDDVRRDTATIMAIDNDVLLGVNSGDATATWPVGVPLVIRATGEVWVRAIGGASLVTVVVEQRAR
jgi:hypothetical protein